MAVQSPGARGARFTTGVAPGGLECSGMRNVQSVILVLAFALGASTAQAAADVWDTLKTSGSVVILRHKLRARRVRSARRQARRLLHAAQS